MRNVPTDDEIKYFNKLNEVELARAFAWLPRERGNRSKALEILKRLWNVSDNNIGACGRCDVVGIGEFHHLRGWPYSKIDEYKFLGIENCNCHTIENLELEMQRSIHLPIFRAIRESETYKKNSRVTVEEIQIILDDFPNKELINVDTLDMFISFYRMENRMGKIKKSVVVK